MAEKKLKLWNGRIYNHEHGYIAAYSVADAVRLASAEYPLARITRNEIEIYWHKNAWGNQMIGITPERGLWIEQKGSREIKRVKNSQLFPVERGPEWAEFQAKQKAEREASESQRQREAQERAERANRLADRLEPAVETIVADDYAVTFEFEGRKFQVREVE